MTDAEPSPGAVEAARRLAGSAASIVSVTPLLGGTHARTWLIRIAEPLMDVVLREYPVDDLAAATEMHVLQVLDGLGGLAPRLLAGDPHAAWSQWPSVLISRLPGHADIIPNDARRWATELGTALARLHDTPIGRLTSLSSVSDRPSGNPTELSGPAAGIVGAGWRQMIDQPDGLVHSDFWSGNVLWDDQSALTGVVDWCGAGVGPAGLDVGWCRLDLYLLYGTDIADHFLDAYVAAHGGRRPPDLELWDMWAVAFSHREVETWVPNYRDLGRRDLTAVELRQRHSRRTEALLDQS